MKQNTVAITVGRFQVPQLSVGHSFLINKLKDPIYDARAVFIGSPLYPNRNNCLDFVYRSRMIKRMFLEHETLTTFNIIDEKSDYVWSDKFDRMVAEQYPGYKVVLLGGRDCFIDRYKGIHKKNFIYCDLPEGLTSPSGTQIRESIIPYWDKGFAEGVIWAHRNQYPSVKPTVDIFVCDKKTRNILVIYKNSDNGLARFPGGFVDLADKNLQQAAIRELKEETNIELKEFNIKYFSSFKIDDWRFSENNLEGIMTTLFFASIDEKDHFIAPGDDADKIGYITAYELRRRIVPEHERMLQSVLLMNKDLESLV